jgi:nucleoside-diphosphate-sugar epimerase
MRSIVIGAGAWGLPTAAELASRGHEVRLVDRYRRGLWMHRRGTTQDDDVKACSVTRFEGRTFQDRSVPTPVGALARGTRGTN